MSLRRIIQPSRSRVVAHSLKSGERKTLVEGASDGWYVPSGHLVYAVGGVLHASAFDVDRLELTGDSVPVVEGVRRSTLGGTGNAAFGVSTTGTLVYVPGPSSVSNNQVDIGLIDRSGTVAPLRLPPGPYECPRVSPDGKRLAVGVEGAEPVILLYDMSRSSALRRLTFGGKNRFPIWTANSKRVVFQSDREGDLGIFWQPLDGTAVAERLTTAAAGESHVPESWHPSSDILLFSVIKGTEHSLWTYSLRDRKVAPFAGVRSLTPTDGVFSPDGRWIAYSVTPERLSQATVFVQPFPATGAIHEPVRKASDQPHQPLWSPDGKELIFNSRPASLDIIGFSAQQTEKFGNATEFRRNFTTGPPSMRRPFDMTPDGKFVGLIAPGDAAGTFSSSQINVILNWFDELKARVPERRAR